MDAIVKSTNTITFYGCFSGNDTPHWNVPREWKKLFGIFPFNSILILFILLLFLFSFYFLPSPPLRFPHVLPHLHTPTPAPPPRVPLTQGITEH